MTSYCYVSATVEQIARDIVLANRDTNRSLSHLTVIQYFGCTLFMQTQLWFLLAQNELLSSDVTIRHLLWTLYFLRVYPSQHVLTTTLNTTIKTFNKYCVQVLAGLSEAYDDVVSQLT